MEAQEQIESLQSLQSELARLRAEHESATLELLKAHGIEVAELHELNAAVTKELDEQKAFYLQAISKILGIAINCVSGFLGTDDARQQISAFPVADESRRLLDTIDHLSADRDRHRDLTRRHAAHWAAQDQLKADAAAQR